MKSRPNGLHANMGLEWSALAMHNMPLDEPTMWYSDILDLSLALMLVIWLLYCSRFTEYSSFELGKSQWRMRPGFSAFARPWCKLGSRGSRANAMLANFWIRVWFVLGMLWVVLKVCQALCLWEDSPLNCLGGLMLLKGIRWQIAQPKMKWLLVNHFVLDTYIWSR